MDMMWPEVDRGEMLLEQEADVGLVAQNLSREVEKMEILSSLRPPSILLQW